MILIFNVWIFERIKTENVKSIVSWNKISPADLSDTCCGDYYAFSRGDKLILVHPLGSGCAFTKILQACSESYYSIYEIDIWIGHKTSRSIFSFVMHPIVPLEIELNRIILSNYIAVSNGCKELKVGA